ncbi:RluA family pseudouridine synthase [Streptococcus ratti]|uniref:Pseudouridine synthase n=2 Tax=Streptococcus ratti TaxID=1341 RepID=A0ABP2R179_STRRT|nr:RluA family pseudouridine synthase [Streptococcus ratti]EJN94998.1 ribosomal large subunit pseudouridine synthase D [Streptococcus ratti FA-1 = DSM 20564]QEY06915.1 RluA family pseudouridine synthase [Streptococcus ratti]VEI59336.1 pseudouridylate synthase [Streptococcus mutans]
MTFTVKITTPYPKGTVKELLEEHLLIPRKIRHFLRIKKHVFINGQNINWQSPVNTGDLIELIFDDNDYPSKTIPMGNKDLADCLYEDEHLIIVNKPEGMKVHGNEPREIALLNHVSSYTGQTCYVVHRLDKETSGAVMFAKNPFILPIVNRLLENKLIQREYWALVKGQFPQKTAVFKEKIGRDRHDRRKRLVDQKHGQTALTHVSLLKYFPNNTSLIKCQLQTGRTHQIRVHLAYHGYPLIGDPLYSKQTADRLMLHAHQLSFIHPLTLQKITVRTQSDSFEKGSGKEPKN